MIASAIAFITALFGFLIGRKSRRANLEKTEAETIRIDADSDRLFISNLQSAINIYKTISDDLQKDLTRLYQKCVSQADEMETLKKELQHKMQENKELRAKIEKLEKTLNHQ